MSSRDEALKLAREIVHGDEPYPTGNSPHTRLSCAKILARALIESEEECQRIRSSASEILTEFNDNMRRLTLMPMETASFDMAVDCMERAIDAVLRREEVRDG